MTLAAGDRRHGTAGGYRSGCRCTACRAANAAAQHDYARLRSMLVPCPGCGGFKHFAAAQCRACYDRDRIAVCGTETGYTQHGCRCRLCREASAAARRARRQRSAPEPVS